METGSAGPAVADRLDFAAAAGSAGRAGTYPRFMEMLNDTDRNFLMTRSVVKCFAKDQVLYVQGDASKSLFIVVQGAVRVHYIQDSGGSLTTSYCREGMLVGAHGCTRWAGNHCWSAQALTDSRVLWIGREHLVALTDRSPHALRCVLAIAEFKAELLKKVIQILAETTVERRIALALHHLGSLYGITRGDEVEIDGHFTHQEIAEMIGASRQSVTTLLMGLEKAGEIRREGRRIFIPSDAATARAKPSSHQDRRIDLDLSPRFA